MKCGYATSRERSRLSSRRARKSLCDGHSRTLADGQGRPDDAWHSRGRGFDGRGRSPLETPCSCPNVLAYDRVQVARVRMETAAGEGGSLRRRRARVLRVAARVLVHGRRAMLVRGEASARRWRALWSRLVRVQDVESPGARRRAASPGRPAARNRAQVPPRAHHLSRSPSRAGRRPGARLPAPRAAPLTARRAPRRSAFCHAVNKVGSARVRASGSRMEGPVRTAPAERSGPFPREAPRRRPEDLSGRAEMVIVGVSLTCRRGWSPPPCWPGPGDADRCAGACEGGVGESAP